MDVCSKEKLGLSTSMLRRQLDGKSMDIFV